MADLFFKLSPLSLSLGHTVDRIRRRSSATLLAALGTKADVAVPVLPALQGEALAKRHLHLALQALHEVGMSKPTRFAKLRLLINKVEQGNTVPSPDAALVTPPPAIPLTRRARLVNRAMRGHLFATLRASSEQGKTRDEAER